MRRKNEFCWDSGDLDGLFAEFGFGCEDADVPEPSGTVSEPEDYLHRGRELLNLCRERFDSEVSTLSELREKLYGFKYNFGNPDSIVTTVARYLVRPFLKTLSRTDWNESQKQLEEWFADVFPYPELRKGITFLFPDSEELPYEISYAMEQSSYLAENGDPYAVPICMRIETLQGYAYGLGLSRNMRSCYRKGADWDSIRYFRNLGQERSVHYIDLSCYLALFILYGEVTRYLEERRQIGAQRLLREPQLRDGLEELEFRNLQSGMEELIQYLEHFPEPPTVFVPEDGYGRMQKEYASLMGWGDIFHFMSWEAADEVKCRWKIVSGLKYSLSLRLYGGDGSLFVERTFGGRKNPYFDWLLEPASLQGLFRFYVDDGNRLFFRLDLTSKLLKIVAFVLQMEEDRARQRVFLRESSKDRATSYITKKNIPEKILRFMEKTGLNERFGYIEVDEDCDLEKVTSLEGEILSFLSLYFPGLDLKKHSLRFRKLGNHRAIGLFYPMLQCLCVDVRNANSFVHEFGHVVDYYYRKGSCLDGGLSCQGDFTRVIAEYRRCLTSVELPKNGKYDLSYYMQPTEVFARSFEIYFFKVVGLDCSILGRPEGPAYPVSDEAYMKVAMDYMERRFGFSEARRASISV